MIKISVIIPVYNAAKSIKKCLETVTTQDLRSIEIICVDDGSTDKSTNIVEELSNHDKRIKLIRQSNLGSGPARNNGIEHAKGEYIAFMDADDSYPDNECLSALYEAAKNNNANVVMGSFSEWDVREQRLVVDWPKDSRVYNYKIQKTGWMDYKDWQMDFGYHRGLYNRKFLNDNKLRFPDLRRYQDPVFMVNTLVAAGKFYGIEKIVYRYKWEEPNITDVKLDAIVRGVAMNLESARKYGFDKLTKWSIESLRAEWARSPMVKDRDNAIYNLERQNNDKTTTINKLNNEIRIRDEEIDGIKHDINNIVNSRTYKAGRIIALPVRAIRRLVMLIKKEQ